MDYTFISKVTRVHKYKFMLHHFVCFFNLFPVEGAEISLIIWLAPWAGKMKQILAAIGYPSGQDGTILPVREYPTLS